MFPKVLPRPNHTPGAGRRSAADQPGAPAEYEKCKTKQPASRQRSASKKLEIAKQNAPADSRTARVIHRRAAPRICPVSIPRVGGQIRH